MTHALRLTPFMLLILGGLTLQQEECGTDDDDDTPAPDYGFWIGETGPTGPIDSGPYQYPFVCNTLDSNLGQPLIDNQEGVGSAVFPEVDGEVDFEAEPLGYSETCSIPTRVDYFYYETSDENFYRFDPEAPSPTMETVTIDGVDYPFLIRVETGTIDRFMYTIAIPAPFEESLDTPGDLDNSYWNRRLVYYLRGGVGIGHFQGEAMWHTGFSSIEREAFHELLKRGYAVTSASGLETGIHYNMNLAGELAGMVKKHFQETYGDPLYTIGIGGSGGAVQQYMFAQNRPGLLDAGIPLYSYPDMVTQTIPIGDCNLLEQYFLEEVDLKGDASPWATWSNRRWIEGMNASDTVINQIWGTPGSTECIEGWWFAEPLVLNPRVTDPDLVDMMNLYLFPHSEISSIRWTHFNDLENIYGTDIQGYAPIPFDNEGVQYGLQALLDGTIGVEQFLEINSCVGSWVDQQDYVAMDIENDPFDSRNMNRDPQACREGVPAPRASGDIGAMNDAYTSGHVFVGDIDIPMIDLRPYLEPELNMHNTRQSFAVRQRMLNYDGDASNLVIWFTGSEDDIVDRTIMAVDVLDDYLLSGERPEGFVDRCFDADGNEIAAGETVWSGILDDDAPGPCTQAYPIYSSSRMVSGAPIEGDLFKCALKPIDTALTDGTYGSITFDEQQESWLRAIFPTGVCDYSLPDQGKP